MFRIALREEEQKRIEYLRGSCGGDFNKEVFFWDIVTKERFDCKEHASAYAKDKINSLDLDLIKIVEVSL